MQKILLVISIFILFSVKLLADIQQPKDFLLPQHILPYHIIEEKKEARVKYSWGYSFYSEFSLKYPYTKSLKNKKIAMIIKRRIKELERAYKNSIYGVEGVIDELNPDNNDSGHFSWDKSIELFSFTPSTATLYFQQSRYTGGAHASYDDYFENYDLNSGKLIDLDDVVTNVDAFRKVAETIYKETYNIPKDKDMRDDGWFNKEFKLAENVAFTPTGFYFLYNMYEIKAYADGLTPLFVPYSRVKKYLNKKYFNDKFYKKASQLAATYHKRVEDELFIDITPKGNNKIHFSIKAINNYGKAKGWLSITFLGKNELKIYNIKSNFEQTKKYPNGTPIYHKPSKKNITKHSMLFEAHSQNWKKDSKSISFDIDRPKNGTKLTILCRLVFERKRKDNSSYYSYYPDEDSIDLEYILRGEQGFKNYKIILNL